MRHSIRTIWHVSFIVGALSGSGLPAVLGMFAGTGKQTVFTKARKQTQKLPESKANTKATKSTANKNRTVPIHDRQEEEHYEKHPLQQPFKP